MLQEIYNKMQFLCLQHLQLRLFLQQFQDLLFLSYLYYQGRTSKISDLPQYNYHHILYFQYSLLLVQKPHLELLCQKLYFERLLQNYHQHIKLLILFHLHQLLLYLFLLQMNDPWHLLLQNLFLYWKHQYIPRRLSDLYFLQLLPVHNYQLLSL